MRHTALARAVFAALVLAPMTASAITDDEVNRVLQFSFSNPGARSLALGGAFTGLADDATAAYANPAGLTILRTQEFGVELRHTEYDTPFASGGTVTEPFNTSGITTGTSTDSVDQLSFASWVYPTERATFSLYYYRLADFESSVDADFVEIGNVGDFLSADAVIGYEVENYGAAVGFKVSDTFSVGLSLAYSDFSIDSLTERRDDPDGPVVNFQRQSGGDNDIAYTIGALWQLSPKWNLGLAYRSGGNFDYDAENVIPGTTNLIEASPSFDVPNVFSAGLAFRPTDSWLFTLDVNHIEYSRLSDDIETIFNSTRVPRLSIDDGTEIRFGAEYAIVPESGAPLFLRAGIWRDPDHRLAYDGATPSNCGLNFDDCLEGALYPEGDDEMHYSLGLGWAFEKFQLDFAADLSDQIDTFSASGVVRF